MQIQDEANPEENLMWNWKEARCETGKKKKKKKKEEKKEEKAMSQPLERARLNMKIKTVLATETNWMRYENGGKNCHGTDNCF